MPTRVLPLLLVAFLLGSAIDVDAAPKYDKKRVQDLAKRWFKARPPTKFVAWDREVRTGLLEEARALGPLPEGALPEVVELLWKAVKKYGPRGRGKIETPYGEATWIHKGGGGRKSGLVLGLHGGGEGAGSASEATKWSVPGHMGMYPQGIRLVHDTWNSVHGERFLLTLIEIAKAQYGVDPDRIYAMGFSMGGTGSMFMAGRHPDLMAGTIPGHGVVPADHTKVRTAAETGNLEHGLVPNLRNVAVWFYTGEEDKNCEPGTFLHAWDLIERLRKDDPTGYGKLRFKCLPKLAHSFPPGEPGTGIKWITKQRREPFPDTLVWEYNDNPWLWPDDQDEGKADRREKRWFYWLHCAAPRDRMYLRATRKKTEDAVVFDLTMSLAFPEDCTVYLNEHMLDGDKDVVLQVDGKEVWRGRPQPDFATVFESLDARLDRTMIFDRKIKVPEDG